VFFVKRANSRAEAGNINVSFKQLVPKRVVLPEI
jgi:hypothetical protein